MRLVAATMLLTLLTPFLPAKIVAQNQECNATCYDLQKTSSGHYVTTISLNNTTQVRAQLESGIHTLLMDSAFAFNHQDELGIAFTPSKSKINLGGKTYNITHRAEATLQLNNYAYYKGEIFLLPAFKNEYEVALPIQNLFHQNGTRCIKLDLKKANFQILATNESVPKRWHSLPMNFDTYLKMPAIITTLHIQDSNYDASIKGNFNLDLGNASLIFLFEQSNTIQEFLQQYAEKIKIHNGYDRQGNIIAKAIIPTAITIGNTPFQNPTIAITKALPKFSTEGCIGLKYFQNHAVIFDFDNKKFYIQPQQ